MRYLFFKHSQTAKTSDSVLLEAQVGGAWGGPKYTLCNDGKFFVNNFLSASLDSSAIDYLKSIYGRQSIDFTFSSDIEGAYDAYRTFHIKYYGKEPVKESGVSNSLESVVNNIDEAITIKTPKTKVMEIGTGRVFQATGWNEASDLFRFNQDEHYSMFADKLFGSWPLLNEKQLAFANSLAYKMKSWTTKRYNYFIKDNEIFNIAVNNLEGKFYFESIFGSKNIYSAEKIKEFDPDLYNQFKKEADNYRPDFHNIELYTLRYQVLDAEKSNIFSHFQRDAYFYIIKDGFYYILPIKFSEREETEIYKYTDMPIEAMFNFNGYLEAKEWIADKNLFPFNDIYEATEITYTLKGEPNYNRYELNQQQLDFINQLTEGRTNYILDNKLFVLDKISGIDNIFSIKRFTIDEKYILVQADLLKLLRSEF